MIRRETRRVRRDSRWWNWYSNPIVPDVNTCIDHGPSKFSIRTSWAAVHGDNGGHSLKDQTIHPRHRKSFPAHSLSTSISKRSAIEPRTPISFPTSANSASSTSTSRACGGTLFRCRLLLCGDLRKLVHDGLLSTNLYGEELKPKFIPELRSYSWTTRHLAPTLYMRIFLRRKER